MFYKDVENYFIPNKENKYAPHGLQKAAMLGMLFLVILTFTATNALSLLWISSQWMVSTVLPAVLITLTNDERVDGSLRQLRHSEVLDRAAQLKADDMAKNEYFAHYSPEGVSPWHWFGKVSYNFVHAGENLAIHFTDSGDVVDAWMDSPSHRANIMNGDYTEIGIGTAEGTYQGYQTVYVVQLFGTPAAEVAQAPSPVVAGESTQELSVAEEVQNDEEVLSESVSISENVAVVEAEPVALEVEEIVSATSPAETASNTQEVVVTNMEITDAGAVLYSDLISTSTGGIPATVQSETIEHSPKMAFFLSIATQPHRILEVMYILIGLFVLGSLLTSIFIEIRHQEPVQIAYGVGLMALMLCLFYIHTVLTNGALIL